MENPKLVAPKVEEGVLIDGIVAKRMGGRYRAGEERAQEKTEYPEAGFRETLAKPY